jgi:hypothetical protein
MRRGFDPDAVQSSLTFEQKITAAWAYHVKGVDQHTLAAIYGVNQGRVAEACKAVAIAIEKDTHAAPQEG